MSTCGNLYRHYIATFKDYVVTYVNQLLHVSVIMWYVNMIKSDDGIVFLHLGVRKYHQTKSLYNAIT